MPSSGWSAVMSSSTPIQNRLRSRWSRGPPRGARAGPSVSRAKAAAMFRRVSAMR